MISSITNLDQGNAVVNEHGTSKHAKTDNWASQDTLRMKKEQMTFNAGASSAASVSFLS